MKNIYLGILFALASAGLFAQNMVTTTNTTDPNSCNGTAVITDSTVIDSLNVWTGNGSVIQYGGMSVSGLCAGTYVLTYSNNSGTFSYTFIIQNGSGNPCANFMANMTTSAVSDSMNCDGSAIVQASGGTAPYVYSWNTGATTSSVTGLCYNMYYCVVTDANGCAYTVTGNVGMSADPADTVIVIGNNGSFGDSTSVGSLGDQWVIDCITNFLDIDSAYVNGYTYVTADSIIVNWTLLNSSGLVVVQISVPYTTPNNATGVYDLYLTLYCPQKSGTYRYLKTNDRIYLNPAMMGVEAKKATELKVVNPFDNELVVYSDDNTALHVILMDLNGRIVMDANSFGSKHLINTTGMNAGNYLLKVISDNGVQTHKLVKL